MKQMDRKKVKQTYHMIEQFDQRFVITGTRQEDGKAFVSMTDLNLEKITELQKKYVEDLPYSMFSLPELQKKATDLGLRSDWIPALSM